MVLFIDSFFVDDLGGVTRDLDKVKYILNYHGLTFKSIFDKAPAGTPLHTGAFNSGRFVVFYSFELSREEVSMCFVDYRADLDGNFDRFADALSPKAVAGFHTLKEEIRIKHQSKLSDVELSSDDQRFRRAFQNQMTFRNRRN